tara:strand:- start:110600 stop:112057 length:1458 start_codon:yes stop_codon:yes gene_type:complete
MGCDSGLSGNFVENQPPVTNLTVERINRGEDFRLSSQINISWWGSDPDGFVVGFEYAINDTSEGAWKFTTKSDSTFILPINGGQNTDDVLFKVRAVDNEGAKDPIGAKLIYPIVNSEPEVSFNINETPPDSMFAISSFGWTVSDPDGFLNIRSTEIAINDTVNGWVEIPFSEENDGKVFISLEYDNTTTGIKVANTFLGRSYRSALDNSGELIRVPNIEVGAKNTAFIRTTDAAGAISEVDTVSWFVKPQNSKVLFINDIEGTSALTKQSLHLSYLEANGIFPDVWLINSGGTGLSEQFPSVIDPTLQKTLAKWDHIYWISNSIARNITFALDITTQFFADGGTMFVNIPMSPTIVNQELELFNFLPIDSIGYVDPNKLETGFIINNNTEVVGLEGAPTLLTQNRQTGIYPLKPLPGASLLYETDFKASTVIGTINDYTRFEGVGIENSEGNLIYFGMDITLLNGNGNLDEFIDYVGVQRLGFSN